MDSQRILKADSVRALGQKVVFDFEDFHERCDSHLAETRQQARQYLNEAQQHAQVVEKQAHKQGFDAGYAEGMKHAEKEIQTRAAALVKQTIDQNLKGKMNVLNSLTQAIHEAKLKWLSHWETASIELCVGISEKIIHNHLESQPALRQAMIREVLEIVSSEQRIIARLHPDDASYFQQVKATSDAFPQFFRTIDFQADETLSPGDCLVEMEHGILDGRVKTQLERIQAELVPHDEA